MSTTLNCVDIIDKRIDVFIERGVIGHRHLNRDIALVGTDVNHIVDERLLASVDVANKLVETSAAVKFLGVRIALLILLTKVGENELHTGVQVGQVTQAGSENAVFIGGGLGENLCIGVESHGSTVFVATIANDVHIGCGLAIGIFLTINLATAANLGTQIVAQRVNTAHTHAVQSARHLIGALVELTTSMEYCHNHLKSRLL